MAEVAPSIVEQPTTAKVKSNNTATFQLRAVGTAPLSYQWQQLNGAIWDDIPGATLESYTTPPVTGADDGRRFRCVVSNPFGSATSGEAILAVFVPLMRDETPSGQAPTDGRPAVRPQLSDNGRRRNDRR